MKSRKSRKLSRGLGGRRATSPGHLIIEIHPWQPYLPKSPWSKSTVLKTLRFKSMVHIQENFKKTLIWIVFYFNLLIYIYIHMFILHYTSLSYKMPLSYKILYFKPIKFNIHCYLGLMLLFCFLFFVFCFCFCFLFLLLLLF